ncbi:hypothetical protein GQ53DRAFT_817823 [Thozetella sp. PMI_491]|nr:hypothetical protein GQ53DRAFT_817823 [Thozetella sp. PMI_491]
MKHRLLILSAALRVIAAQSTVTVTASAVAANPPPLGSPVASVPIVASATAPAAPPAATGGSSSSAAVCGQGYTYCGYILRDHQNYPQDDIVKAYCSGEKDNCASGKTKTDPFQALYVCLPNNASPSPQHEVRNRLARLLGHRQVLAATANPAAPTGATTGNKIELLCACGGKCLNPDQDHIGRCDSPCS